MNRDQVEDFRITLNYTNNNQWGTKISISKSPLNNFNCVSVLGTDTCFGYSTPPAIEL